MCCKTYCISQSRYLTIVFYRHFMLMMMSYCATALDWCFHHLSPQRLRWCALGFYQLIK